MRFRGAGTARGGASGWGLGFWVLEEKLGAQIAERPEAKVTPVPTGASRGARPSRALRL